MSTLLPTSGSLKLGMTQIQQPLILGAWGAAGGAVASLLRTLMVTSQAIRLDSPTLGTVDTAIAFGLIGFFVSLAISIGHSQYVKRRFVLLESTKIALSGLAAGCVAGVLAENLFRAVDGSGGLHVVVWGITGGLIGLGLSFWIPNLNLWTAVAGGAAGGLIGGACSVWITVSLNTPEFLARVFAFAAIGFFIPFALFSLETVLRPAGATAHTAPGARPPVRAAVGFSLRFANGKTVSLVDGVKLSTADIPGLQASSGSNTVAEVGRNPNDPNVLGLKNLSRTAWTATVGSQNRVQVGPGRNVRIASGTKISFGSVDAEIQ